MSLETHANEIQVRTFDELINSQPVSGDTIEFAGDMTSDATIGQNFYNLDITFEGNNHSINGGSVFGGFVLNEDSFFNHVRILNCKGQEYNRSNFAGAIYNSGGNLNIEESAFSGNFTDAAGFNFGVGGAVYNLNGGTSNINKTLFEDNYSNGASSYGGAVANGYQQGATAEMTISDSIFNNNYAYGSLIPHGGAIYNNGNLTVSNTLFNGNYAEGPQDAYSYGGAFTNEGTGKIENSSFSNNYIKVSEYSLAYGGAISNTTNLDISNTIFENNYTESGENSRSTGGSIYSSGTLTLEKGLFKSNSSKGSSEAFGGALYNETGGNVTVNGTNWESNSVLAQQGAGGAVYNLGTITMEGGSILKENTVNGNTSAFGGALYNGVSGNVTVNNANWEGNSVSAPQGAGGALYNLGTVTMENNSLKGNSSTDGGAVYNGLNANVTIKNSILEDNRTTSANGKGGAIYNSGTLTVENSTLQNNKEENGGLNDIYNNNAVVELAGNGTNNILSGIAGTGTVSKTGSGVLNLGGVNKNFTGDFNLNGGTLNLLANSSYFSAQNTSFANNPNFNMQNNEINSVNFGNLTLNGSTNIQADLDFNTRTMDRINASSVNGSGSLFVNNLAMKGAPEGESFSIPFADSVLKNYVDYNATTIHTPIYNYRASYNSASGDFDFTRGSLSPAVFAPAVAAQIAGYLTQLETYKNIFANLDMVMITPPDTRGGFAIQNKTAAGGQFAFSPFTMPEQNNGIWFKPYTTFENVPLKNGPKVSNVSYGALIGGESGLKKLPHNWYALYGGYASYNGSHQTYSGNSIYNNGGLIGADAVFYKGKFFSAWTANIGANVAEANTIDSRDEFTMLNTGIAEKTGYNFETLDRRLIIQPSLIMSYSFINTFNYTTKSTDVHMNSDPLHAIHIEPQIKFIGNFKNYLQPYLSVSMVWNIIDDTKFQANDVYLPELSIKPFVQYGAGVQKRWGDRVTGFLEGMIRNGGRNGIALMFGLRISI